ncbi:unnamed protein product [Cladocopium goreaui]|uniref:Uncharacterized protein n=1 Tax=Cladocopium goreaui TaxID=2562237 RepID=A0A9P1FVF1_9DINO|nr:unnamed protein product [Cladocopium goreaui]
MTPVPAKPERPSPAPSPSVNKKAKCSAPRVPDSMVPPPEAPLKKTKTEKACAVKGTGRPPATPLANPLAAPPPVAAHAAMVLRPPPPKASPPACPETEPSPGTPAYVNVHGVPVPMSKAGVKMEVRPTQNTAAAALRKQKARPSMKVEQREDTLPPSASLALDTSAKASRPTSPISPTSTESTAPSPSSAKASPTSAKAISPSSTTAALAKANTPSPDDHSTAPTPATCPAPTPTPDDGKTTETDIQREERVRAWVCKMDDVEITRSIQKAERHSLFPQFELWRRDEIFGVGGDEDIPRFGADDEEEELVSWLMWLEDPSRPCVENALPDPNPEETALVAVAKKPKQVTFTQNVTVHSLPDTAAPAKATTSILKPAAKMPVLKPLTLAPAPPMKASAAAPPQAAPAAMPLPPAPARATPATATTLPVPPPAKHAAAPHVPAAVPPRSLALPPPASASPKPAASPLPAAPASNGMIPASQLASQIHISAPVGAEVTFEGYKERQAHYAQMKRPVTGGPHAFNINIPRTESFHRCRGVLQSYCL